MKKLTITLFTLLFFVTVSYAQELNSKIKPVKEGDNPSTSEIKNEDIPKVSTFARMNNFSAFKAGDIVYDTNLEAHYQYLGDSTWILSDKFSPKKSSSYLTQLSTLSTLSGAPTLNATQAAAGQVAFYTGASTTDGNSNFIWDNANRRLGIGKASPQVPLDVAGQINADSLNINGIYIGRGRGRVESNTAVGINSLSSNTTGYYNNGFGYFTLLYNTVGIKNNAFGYQALRDNTTGNHNNGFGYNALTLNTTGYSNSAFGNNVLTYNTTGGANSAFGTFALRYNTIGIRNTAMGYRSLQTNRTGNQNNSIGFDALTLIDGGNSNIAIGDSAGYNQVTGNKNIFIGTATALPNSTGSNQLVLANSIYGKNIYDSTAAMIGIGTANPQAKLHVKGGIIADSINIASFNADSLNINGIYIGRGGGNDTTNTAVGRNALVKNIISGRYFYGRANNAFGNNALQYNTTGHYNVAFGNKALYTNTTGNYNVSVGVNSSKYNREGTNNTVVGTDAMFYNTLGSFNSIVGSDALEFMTLGSKNVVMGSTALPNVIRASSNIALGDSSGYNLTSGNKNIVIGSQVAFPDTSGSNQLVLANSIYGKNIYDSTAAMIGIGIANPTAKLDINGSIRIRGGVPGEGKVLTSDANGNARWQNAGGGIYSGSGTISSNTTVDLGANSLSFIGTGGASGKSFSITNTSGDYNPAFRVISTSPSNGWNQSAQFMMPNMQTGGKNMIGFGKSWSPYNTGYIYYYHAGESTNINQIRIGFHSADDIVSIGANNITTIKGRTYTNADNTDIGTIESTIANIESRGTYIAVPIKGSSNIFNQGIAINENRLFFGGAKYEVSVSMAVGGKNEEYNFPVSVIIAYENDTHSGVNLSQNKASFNFYVLTNGYGTHFDSSWSIFTPTNNLQPYKIFLVPFNPGARINIDKLIVRFRRIG